VQRFPRGSGAASISPFNFPETCGAKRRPALAAGCPVILKPASKLRFTALALGVILKAAGRRAGVLPLSNADTAWLSKRKTASSCQLTGSAKVGWELKAHTGQARAAGVGRNAALIVGRLADWMKRQPAPRVRLLVTPASPAWRCQRVFVERGVFQTFL